MEIRRFKIYTLGCKVNQYESQAIREQLEGIGLVEAKLNQEADFCIINTCTVTSVADRKSRNFIRKAKRENNNAKIIVTGCYVQQSKEILSKIPEIDYCLRNEEKNRIIEYIQDGKTTLSNSKLKISRFDGHTRAFVKIQDGCDNFCSFCKIPYVRGRSTSRGLNDIVEEVQRLSNNGYREIVLTGICLGDYGKGLKTRTDLVDLIDRIEKIEPVLRIRLSSIDAEDINNRLIEKMRASRKLCPHLHIPFQSGDDRVLRLMNRCFSRDNYLELVARLKKTIKDIAITADIMVGFPNEDEEAFANTVELVKKILPLKLHIFIFNPRENTRWEKFKIDYKTAKKRFEILKVIEQEASFSYKKNFIKKELFVLPERKKDGLWQGYSQNYIRVYFKSKSEFRNRLVKIKIEDLFRDGLIGTSVF